MAGKNDDGVTQPEVEAVSGLTASCLNSWLFRQNKKDDHFLSFGGSDMMTS